MNKWEALTLIEEQPKGTIAVCSRGAVWIKKDPNQWVRHTEEYQQFGAMPDTDMARHFSSRGELTTGDWWVA